MGQKILLVEGDADKLLFKKICEKIGLEAQVKVLTPKEGGKEKNGKKEAIDLLLYLNQLEHARITHLGMVLDADFSSDNWGYEATLNCVKEKITKANLGYNDPVHKDSGLFFPHSDGLNNIGLWIMPNNKSEGMLENWIADVLKDEDPPLLDYASQVINNLPTPKKFKDIHRIKSEITTWLAWQKIPGQSFDTLVETGFNEEHPVYLNLISWLKKVFSV